MEIHVGTPSAELFGLLTSTFDDREGVISLNAGRQPFRLFKQ